MQHERQRHVVTGCLSVLMGALSLWQLWEQDALWQVRAGHEILSGAGLQWQDTWSFTAHGREWLNYEWLASVLLYAIYSAGGVPGLVIARGVIAAVLFYFSARLAQGAQPRRN